MPTRRFRRGIDIEYDGEFDRAILTLDARQNNLTHKTIATDDHFSPAMVLRLDRLGRICQVDVHNALTVLPPGFLLDEDEHISVGQGLRIVRRTDRFVIQEFINRVQDICRATHEEFTTVLLRELGKL